ncbi:MAG TPA: hypothetical protein VKF32_00840 [Thermoanaerobaculia bacterium]|nr:hypothetical protein [Thermoanaerobaculia bacterium]
MSEAARVDPRHRFGQVGETWGNLLMEEGALEPDQEIVFEGDETAMRYWITRVNLYPLDASKRLFYYQAHPRSKDSTMERPHTPTVQ